MSLSSEQIERWEHQPQTQTAITAHEEIRTAILGAKLWLGRPEIFLQGSYANDTNTHNDHDVDVVVQINPAFLYHYNIDDLSDLDKQWVRDTVGPATASLDGFRTEILQILNRRFGYQNVIPGNKAVKVKGSPGHKLDADVVICNQYRRYYDFAGNMDEHYHEGIYFKDSGGNTIVNYPKLHKSNGVTKHQQTNKRFKPTVRAFKNARRRAIENGLLGEDVAPSYFIQGLLYNVDSSVFSADAKLNFLEVLIWLVDNQDKWASFKCQNGIDFLFGETDVQWDVLSAMKFLHALLKMSNS